MIDPAERRRRRLTLAGLVVVCLVLITAGFGSSSGGASGGPIGSLGDGVSKVAKPVRDVFHWFGSTADAKNQGQDLRKERDALRAENRRLSAAQARIPGRGQLSRYDAGATVGSLTPVTASVVGRSPTAWTSTIRIDKGQDEGVEEDQAVVGPDGPGSGLVGTVSTVRASSAVVTMLPTPGLRIGARLPGAGGSLGFNVLTVQGSGSGSSTDLELLYVPAKVPIGRGQLVVTSGTTDDPGDPRATSPPGIPIGRVSHVSRAGEDDQVGHLKPLVDLRSLERVQVLTGASRRRTGASGR